ncbi:MAG: esterase-like activity of phytase family protein [Alphaproteobacteria bacterium]|nr:esterase-like activity of phytase family protein [Alphaproteobacteria bacterium]
MKKHRSNILLGLFLGTGVLLVLFSGPLLRPDVGEVLASAADIEVRAVPVPLNTERPAEHAVGKLSYLGGWSLTSAHDRFGGLSGLVVKDGRSVVAVTDQGDWFTADFNPGAGTIFSGATLRPFEADMQDASKAAYDAESIIALGDDYLVSFEFMHRLMVARPDGTNHVWKNNYHIDYGALADNSGLEAIVLTADNKLLAFAERGKDTLGRQKAWLVDDAGAVDLYFTPPPNFAPTDAARLPNGDILLLTRFFSLADGNKIKLLRIKAEDIQAGATLRGEELAHMEPPFTVDNMEGLDIGVAPDGSVVVYLVSDDNFRASQRTLFMVFKLAE